MKDAQPKAVRPLPVVELGRKSDREPDGPASLKQIGGSHSRAFNSVLCNSVLNTVWCPSGTPDQSRDDRYVAALAVVQASKPTDEIEAMLAAQAVAMHYGSMECFRRAMIPDQPGEFQSKLRKDGANLARGMVEMLDALDRRRGKATRQIVRVERVTVQPGGQAIVGTVTAIPRRGGSDAK